MKKKLLFVFIVFVMIFAIAGCGENQVRLELPEDIRTIVFYNFDETQIVIEDAKQIQKIKDIIECASVKTVKPKEIEGWYTMDIVTAEETVQLGFAGKYLNLRGVFYEVCGTENEIWEDVLALIKESAERIDYFDYISDKSFKYENEGILGDFIIQINSDGTFSYSEGAASSYLGIGNWKIENNIITLVDEKLTNSFEIQDGKLRWIESGSDIFTYIEVKDGEEFYEYE